MAKDYRIKARIDAEDNASDKLKDVGGSVDDLGTKLKVGLVAAAAAAAAGIVALGKALKDAIGFANVQEEAIVRLNAALTPLGDEAAGVSQRLQDYASGLQQVTRFGDETIIRGQSLIASFTKNEEEIKKATKAALDLASATGTNLNSAFLLLGRAAAGETSMLSRYGIALDEGIPKSEKFAAAIEKINAQFGGQAQAQAKTFSGIVEQITNAWGDHKETVGFAVTQNEEMLGVLARLKEILTSEGFTTAVATLAEKTAEATTKTAEWTIAAYETSEGLAIVRQGLNDYLASLEGVEAVTEARLEQLKKEKGIQDDQTGIIGRLVGKLREISQAKKQIKETEEILNVVMEAHTALLRDEGAAYEFAADKTERYKQLMETVARVESEAAERITRVTTSLEALGITTDSQVTAALERERQKLEEIRMAYDQRLMVNGELLVDAKALAEAEDALAKKMAELRGEVDDANTSVDTAAKKYNEAGNAADNYADRVGNLTEQLDRNTQAQERQSSRDDGGSSFSNLSGGTFQFTERIVDRGTDAQGRRYVVVAGGRRVTF